MFVELRSHSRTHSPVSGTGGSSRFCKANKLKCDWNPVKLAD